MPGNAEVPLRQLRNVAVHIAFPPPRRNKASRFNRAQQIERPRLGL